MLEQMQARGIPTVVWLTPILPFINDTEENVKAVLNECVRVGVKGIICFGMGVTLREGDREYYYAALDKHFPGLKNRYIKSFGNQYECASPDTNRLMLRLSEICKKNNIMLGVDSVFKWIEDFPGKRFPGIFFALLQPNSILKRL